MIVLFITSLSLRWLYTWATITNGVIIYIDYASGMKGSRATRQPFIFLDTIAR